jgi:8-oxo-dGTP diphosphatase
MGDRACAIVVEHGRLLMVRQTYRGTTFWTFPGGALLAGETPEDAATREVHEETGLTIRIVKLLCRTARRTGPGTYSCYLGEVLGGEAMLGSDAERPEDAQVLHDLRWFPLDDVPEHPEVARVWTSLIAHLHPSGRDGDWNSDPGA